MYPCRKTYHILFRENMYIYIYMLIVVVNKNKNKRWTYIYIQTYTHTHNNFIDKKNFPKNGVYKTQKEEKKKRKKKTMTITYLVFYRSYIILLWRLKELPSYSFGVFFSFFFISFLQYITTTTAFGIYIIFIYYKV